MTCDVMDAVDGGVGFVLDLNAGLQLLAPRGLPTLGSCRGRGLCRSDAVSQTLPKTCSRPSKAAAPVRTVCCEQNRAWTSGWKQTLCWAAPRSSARAGRTRTPQTQVSGPRFRPEAHTSQTRVLDLTRFRVGGVLKRKVSFKA